MDLKTLKLELLERIALLDDEIRLLALKRLLDSPRGYGIPNDNLSVVKEDPEPYIKLEDRSYSAEEVRKLMEELLQARNQNEDFASAFTPEEWEAMDWEGVEAERDEGTFLTIEEVMERMRKDLGK
ncbi:MAG: hypothetical protein LKM36_15490 [Flavobacteriales bacterium]|jgi:hypothetical protein|nr:hypothetical protein [Flavobacteriales bacterium]